MKGVECTLVVSYSSSECSGNSRTAEGLSRACGMTLMDRNVKGSAWKQKKRWRG